MSIEENKEVTRRFVDEVINGQDQKALEELTTRDYALYFPGLAGALDRSQSREIVSQLHTAFPDLRITAETAIADGDWVAMMFTVTGTNDGPFQGIQPTGKRIRVPGSVFYQLRDGMIVEDHPVFDRMTMFEQMGIAVQVGEPALASSRR
jgi:predicted ester cyclase